MTQTRLASFLSPVRAEPGPCTQSLPCGQLNPAPTNEPQSAEQRPISPAPVLPKRTGHKSKKVIRAIKKSQRKRDKNNRAKSQVPRCKSDNDVNKSTSTPISSNRATASVMSDDSDDGLSLLDRSLRDMLVSGDEGSPEDPDSSDATTDHQQRVIEVESKLVATEIALEGEQNEVARLKAHIELLESDYTEQKSELDNLRKILNKQKSEIKRLYRDNDSLRREISRYNGIRKYTDGNACNSQTDNTDKIVTEILDAHAKFREKITDIAGLLIDTLDDCPGNNAGFTSVTNKKGKSQGKTVATHMPKSPTYSHVLSRNKSTTPVSRPSPTTRTASASRQPPVSRQPESPASRQPPASYTTATHRRPSSGPQSHPNHLTPSISGGQPIPVVQPGIGRPQPASSPATPTATDPNSEPNHRLATRTRTIVIGTSLLDGLGHRLNKFGEQVTTYMYRGATVPVLQNRIRHVLNSREQPEKVVLQCGGNDAERQPAEVISTRIESLVHDIRRLCPMSDIIINKVPPRGNSQKLNNNIKKLNSCLAHRYRCDNHVQVIDVCPKSPQFYQRDLVHFNSKGSFQFAKQLADCLSNFYWTDRKMWI